MLSRYSDDEIESKVQELRTVLLVKEMPLSSAKEDK